MIAKNNKKLILNEMTAASKPTAYYTLRNWRNIAQNHFFRFRISSAENGRDLTDLTKIR